MPPRNPELPEGTDHIVTGAGEASGRSPVGQTGGRATTATTPATTGGQPGGFVASGGGNDTGGTARSGQSGGGVRDKLKEQAGELKDQATGKLRSYADDGKSRATGVLDEFCGVIEDAAKSIDDRLGPEYGEYAHKAADYVSGWTAKFRDKSVDELLDDTRSAVRASPGIAIAAAAIAGFALMRVVRTGIEDLGGGSGSDTRSTGAGGSARTSGTTGTRT